jgi:hypothetical protein
MNNSKSMAPNASMPLHASQPKLEQMATLTPPRQEIDGIGNRIAKSHVSELVWIGVVLPGYLSPLLGEPTGVKGL